MVYREWFSLRLKLLLWGVAYGGGMLVFLFASAWPNPMTVTIYQQAGQDVYNTLFGGWLTIIIVLTPVLALLGSIDLISEENGKGTLSFLLTRPLTRTRIYTTKILLSTGTLVAVCGLSSLLVLLVDQLPRRVLVSRWTTAPCGENAYCSGWSNGVLEVSRPAELIPALTALGIILAAGTLLICATGLLSIFTRSMLQNAITAATPVLIIYLVLNANGPFARTSQFAPMQTELLNWAELGQRLGWMVGLSGGAVIVFLAGLIAFNRKEF